MGSSQVKKDALELSKYFLSLPHPAKTLAAILALSFLFGIVLGAFRKPSQSSFEALAAGIDGLFLLAFPAILSSVSLFLVRRKALLRRSLFLGLLSTIAYGAFYLLSASLSGFWPGAANLVYVGFALAFVLWYFVLLLAFGFRKSALFLAAIQAMFFAIFFMAGWEYSSSQQLQDIVLRIYLASFIFLAALYALFYFISAPMKKNLGISSLDALSMFASQWLYRQKDLEEVFEEFGEEVETMVWVGEFAGRKNHAIFVVPYIHFGPFGNLGGSEFTWMIAERLSKIWRREKAPAPEVFVFHGTVTHDFNPVSSSEIDAVLSACTKALRKLRLSNAKMAHYYCRVGTVRAQAYHINSSAFVSFSRAPRTTEDVNLGLGLAIMESARRKCKSVAVVDEHNAETGDITSVEVGSPIGFEMLEAAGRLFESRKKQEKFLFGVSSGSLQLDALGKNGMKLALFKQAGRLRAILLIDSNGVVPEFRQELVGLFASLGREIGLECAGEVMTTDTHQINTVKGVLNPIGSERRGDIMMLVRRLFHQAMQRMEEVRFDSSEERFRIKVFGAGQSAEIASTINGVVAMLRLALPVILLASAAVLLWALGKI
ncbi:MAG: DUF2070 family protein [Candidatus Micrarchaeota archaeon]|nr:DUF2070 family protein [Candidatus Micrarchaeota archaeon]